MNIQEKKVAAEITLKRNEDERENRNEKEGWIEIVKRFSGRSKRIGIVRSWIGVVVIISGSRLVIQTIVLIANTRLVRVDLKQNASFPAKNHKAPTQANNNTTESSGGSPDLT